MRAYHLDRLKTLSIGQVINLKHYSDVKPAILQHHVDMLFPSGVSLHGEHYMLRSNLPSTGTNQLIELIFEYVRRSHFPSRPSRFESFFAFQSIDDICVYGANFDITTDIIWEVETEEEAFKADATFLNTGSSPLVLSYFAHCYWSGQASSTPKWELLLVPPVKVIKALTYMEIACS